MEVMITSHARQRMMERGISEKMMQDCLENPDKETHGYHDRSVCFKKFDDKYIKAVYEIVGETRRIITVMWKDKL